MGRAGDETVAVAIEVGRLRCEDIVSRGLASSSHSADLRIQAAHKAGRIVRVEWGQYVAARDEYARAGLDPSRAGERIGMRWTDVLARMPSSSQTEASAARVACGEYIRTLRLAGEITQRKLAQVSGVAQSSICRIERGRWRMPEEVLPRVAETLAGFDIETFRRLLGEP